MSPFPAPPRIWFFDTCTLMNLQVSAELDTLVQTQMTGETCVLLQAVVDELERIAEESNDGLAVDLADKALANAGWLGTPHPIDEWADLEEVTYWQDQVADGRALKHEFEHWAESCIIAAVEVLPEKYGAAAFLSDEYSARVQANKHAWCSPYSVHRFMYELVQDGTLDPTDALSIALELEAAGRGPEVELADFTNPTPRGLGRSGQP